MGRLSKGESLYRDPKGEALEGRRGKQRGFERIGAFVILSPNDPVASPRGSQEIRPR
jgi:hypothetical protein